MVDCIIVGAGPAGATAAYHLAKRGRSVLVLEKETFPRHKPCGGGVSPAVSKWFDFDFTPVIDNTVNKVCYSWKHGDKIEIQLNDVEPMWMVQRDAFDNFLIQQARDKGAEFREATEVRAIELSGDRWQVATSKGTEVASYLIAADGVKGPMAAWLGFEQQHSFGATLEVPAEVPPQKQNTAYFDFGSLKNGYIWNFPKSNGYSLSAGFLRGSKGKSKELNQQLTNYAQQFGLNLANAQYFEYPLNIWTENYPLHANRALLIGEAAGILDPLTGEGIRPSIFTGLKAAEAVDAALTGFEESLPEYTQNVSKEWGSDMVLAGRLAGLFYQFPKIAYKVGVKRPAAAQIMGKILCGELRYSDVTEQAIKKLRKSLIPGMGR